MMYTQPHYNDGYEFWIDMLRNYSRFEAKEKAKRYLRIPLPNEESKKNEEIAFRNELIRAIEDDFVCDKAELAEVKENWALFVRLSFLQDEITDFLSEAPTEEECSDEENEVFANLQNLKESIEQLFITQSRS